MSLLLLVRHGQASWGAADYDRLSEQGFTQSAMLGRSLAARGIRPSVVLTGAMRRHHETARTVVEAAGWDVSPVEDGGWNEFDHRQMLELHPAGVGQSDGTQGEQMTKARFQKWFEEATLRWTGGEHDKEYDESFGAFGDRVGAAVRRAVDRLSDGGTAVVFTSGGPISHVAASLLGGGAALWLQLNPVTVNASVSKVVVGGRGLTLVSFNDHGHLEAADGGLVTYR
jgi:broad specificity phosphatase PhoE